jgi:hypothetical protein
MARRPSAARPRGGDSPFIKVTGKLASWLGIKASSGRYLAREALAPLEEAHQVWEAASDAIDGALDDATRLLRDQLRAQTVCGIGLANRSSRARSTRNKSNPANADTPATDPSISRNVSRSARPPKKSQGKKPAGARLKHKRKSSSSSSRAGHTAT